MKRLYFLIFAITAMMQVQAQAQKAFDNNLRKLGLSLAYIQSYYVDQVDGEKAVEDAIIGMLGKLDPHSSYTNAKETLKVNEPLQGSFDGIGVQFNMLEDTVVVIQAVPKGPSAKVGILPGDRIISVADTAIAGVKMSKEEIMRRLRGPRGSIAHLGIRREGVGETLFFDVRRDKIPINSVDAAYMVTDDIGLVRFNNFAQNTRNEIVAAIDTLRSRGMKNLIVDLTQNGGGYLQAAAEVCSEFLPSGDLIVYTQGRVFPRQDYFSSGGNAFQKGKLVVLVDEFSASAAEIFAGAIQDQDRGTIVGRRSFGKGLVQYPYFMPDHSMIRLTVAKYYTPSGRCIQKPYVKGKKNEYDMDVINRLNKGELTNADSIHFPDSLCFKTLRQQRTVYGGGGIMPDIFIPLDTLRNPRMFRQISAKNILINANLRFMDKNRSELTSRYPRFDEYLRDYHVPDKVIEAIFAEAGKQGIKAVDEKDRKDSEARARMLLKALIARDLWDMSEYFAVIYQDDEMVRKAVEVLSGK